MRQLIVGIGHKKDRGKDTLSDLIINRVRMEHSEVKIRKVGFADKLKAVAHDVYGWADLQPGIYYDTRYKLKEVVLPKLGKTPRQIWIAIGNGFREIYGPTWIEYCLKSIDGNIILIKDLGFINEAKAIRDNTGLLIRIDRDGPMGDDPREVELDNWTDWDYDISNQGTMRDLNIEAVSIADKLVARL